MRLSLTATIMFTAGVILMYAAVKNKDPRDVIREIMNKSPQHPPISEFGEKNEEQIQPMTPINVPGVRVVTV